MMNQKPFRIDLYAMQNHWPKLEVHQINAYSDNQNWRNWKYARYFEHHPFKNRKSHPATYNWMAFHLSKIL